MYYSYEDLERFYFKYQAEALPHGQSVQSFCLNNNVPYNIFSKWYRDTRRKVVPVQVDGRPTDEEPIEKEQSVQADSGNSKELVATVPEKKNNSHEETPRIWVELHLSNGLYLSRKNLNYQGLRQMIEKLEGLC